MQKTMIKLSLCGAVAGLALLLPAGLARAGEAPTAGVELLLGALLAGGNRNGQEQLPDAVAKTVRERFPAASVLSFDRNHRRGVLCYDVLLRQLERRTQVEVAADGSVGEIQSRLSLESLPAAHQAMVLAITGDGELRSIDTHLRLGLAHAGTFALLDEPVGFYDVRYQRAEGERTRLVKVSFKGDETLTALTGSDGGAAMKSGGVP
jgi:hypothetical protein